MNLHLRFTEGWSKETSFESLPGHLKKLNHLDRCFIVSTLLLTYIPNKNIVKQATTDAFNEVILTSYWGIQTKRNPPTT